MPFAFLNTHIDHKSFQAQMNSMDLLISKVRTYAARMPVVLVGDFNYHPDSEPYSRLAACMRDSYREDPANTEDACITWHDFTGRQTVNERSNEGRIDYVWLKGDVRVECSWIVFDRPGSDPELYPSDHWPIVSDLVLGP
jgi:endonuclease/exonuclease/phosphatase family metal-dependent hydrolase